METILNIFSAVLQNKIAEKEVKKREKLLSLVTDNMLNIVGQTDAEGTFQYISPSIKTVLGYEPREIPGESVFKLINLTHPGSNQGQFHLHGIHGFLSTRRSAAPVQTCQWTLFVA